MRRPSSGCPAPDRSECPARTSVTAAKRRRGSSMPRSSAIVSRNALLQVVLAAKYDRRHRVAQHAGPDGMALGVVGIEQALRRSPLDHLRQLPSQVHGILDAGLQTLAAVGGMHMRGIARDQRASLAVGLRLPRGISEPGNRGGRVDSVVGPVNRDERRAKIAKSGLGGLSNLLFGHEHADRPVIRMEQSRRCGFRTLCPTEGVGAEGVTALDAPLQRRLGEFGIPRSGCW